MVTKTYLPSNICDSSDSNDTCNSSDCSDSSDSCDSSDSSVSSDSSDSSDGSDSSERSYQKKNHKKTFFYDKKISQKNSKTKTVLKLKNSNCHKTQKLKL